MAILFDEQRQAYLRQIRKVAAAGPYYPTWESLCTYEIPSWYRKAKFGIFMHWGVYSVPAFANEWYSRNMYIKDSYEYKHHIETYGPHDRFGYKDFIPMFTAERFDPDEWAEILSNAGARYVIPVGEHHDGFQMYASSLSHYNAAEMGPCRDTAGELRKAFNKRGMEYGTSSHRAEHQWFMGPGRDFPSDMAANAEQRGQMYWPATAQQPNMDDRHDPLAPTEEYLEDWLLRCAEMVDRYDPRLFYFDWWIRHDGYSETLRTFIAYYYNRAAERGYPCGVCYKRDGLAFGAGIYDMERGKFAEARPYYWQTDTAIARNSWCYTDSLDYKTAPELVRYLADVTAKNGNLLLNVGPKADGTIPLRDREILAEMGRWLAVNGEAIYDTESYLVSEEGPTAEAVGEFSDGAATVYTSEDYRFTAGHGCVYAICMQAPANGEFTVKSLRGDIKDTFRPVFQSTVADVQVLGYDGRVEWKQGEDALHVSAPGLAVTDMPVVVKVRVL